MDESLNNQMKAVEEEKRRLKRMHADLSLQADLLKKALLKRHGQAQKSASLSSETISRNGLSALLSMLVN